MDMTVDWPELVRHPGERDHVVHVYRETAFLVEAVAEFIGTGLALGEAGLVIARPALREALLAALAARRLYPNRALRFLDAGTVLEAIMREGAPQWPAFEAQCGGAIAELRLQYPGLRAYGEMVDLLWQQGQRAAALRLEEYWNELGRLRPFALLCAYRMDPLDGAAYGGGLELVCKAHTHLIPARDYAAFNRAVADAARRVLSEPLAHMLASLSATHRPSTDMPFGQAMLFWLKQNMPRTAEKVLGEVRAKLAA
jgi:hypothetical protein